MCIKGARARAHEFIGILLAKSFLAILVGLIVSACSPKVGEKITAESLVLFPDPPEQTRIQFLTSISKAADVVEKRSGIGAYITGEEDRDEEIVKPYGIAIRNNRIYVCDTQLNALHVIDLEDHSFEVLVPHGLAKLKKPINVFAGENGLLYVADSERGEIVVMHDDGSYVASIGGIEGMKPTDVFVAGDTVWVADLGNRLIRAFSATDRSMLFSFPDPDDESLGQLFSPINLTVSADRVYVTDFGDFKVKVYTKAGEYQRSIGEYGRTTGQFVRPKGIAIDHDQNLYVADAGSEIVQIFNNEGQPLMPFGGTYEGPGGMWLPAKVIVDYDHLDYFQKYVYEDFRLLHLILVTNQYGPDKINVYGFVEPK